MLKRSYVSTQYIDSAKQFTYAHNKINAVIINDVDNNGFLDLITFPSNFTIDVPLNSVVWSNTGGVFSPNTAPIKNAQPYQYFRDSVAGDFNNDGRMDYFQADQGWELNNRDTSSFLGSHPALLLGGSNGLTWQPLDTWLTNPAGSRTFNHIADAADFNGDGDLDVVVAGFSNFKIYENRGNGTFTQHQDMVPSRYNSPGGNTSGVSFIQLGDRYAIATGDYRAWSATAQINSISILTETNGRFTEAYSLARPILGQGRERNYGASEMFNMDLNGDGREDLVVTWETETFGGYNDGLSNTSTNPQTLRYSDLGNTLVSIYFQDANGRLVADNAVYGAKNWTSGAPLFFEDFNLDGHVDFYLGSYGQKPSEFDQLVFINNGKGQFANPQNRMFNTDETFPDWYKTSPFFFDANRDGAIDVVAVQQVFAPGNTHTIGQELRTFLSEGPAYNINGNNKFSAVLSDRTHDGQGGVDTAIFSGKFSDYTITVNSPAKLTTKDNVAGRDGQDTFVNVERAKFDNANIAFDTSASQAAGQTALLIGAVLPGRLVYDVSKQALVGNVINLFDDGYTVRELAGAVLRLDIWDVLTGNPNPTNYDIANYLLTNISGAAPSQTTLNSAVNALNTENFQGDWLASVVNSTANQNHIDLVGLQTTGLVYL